MSCRSATAQDTGTTAPGGQAPGATPNAQAPGGVGGGGRSWTVTTAVTVGATLTDNVNLSPPGQQETDLYTTITPTIAVQHQAPRLKFNASFSPTVVLYADQPPNNQLFNTLAASGNLEAVKNFFYIDASVFVNQTFLTLFAPQPASLGTNTPNRVETRTATLSPYIQGVSDSGISYSLRNTQIWTNTNSSLANDVGFIGWTGHLDQTRGANFWGADYYYQETVYESQPSLITQSALLRLGRQVDPELGLSLRLGYQKNNYFIEQPDNYIYGVGFNWTPTPRAQASGYWEHQYFGSSYQLSASYRRRLTAFTLSASRNASTYPQLGFTLPAGNTASLLDAALTAQFPDPVERQNAVNQFVQATGLPTTLLTPYSYYTNTVALVQQTSASVAFLGAHNSLILSGYYLESQNIVQPGVALPAPLFNNSDFTSWGPSASYSHDLSPKSKLNLLATWSETKSNIAPFTETTSGLVRALVTTQFDPKTTGGIGARIYRILSTGTPVVMEHAVFVTLYHVF